MDTLKQGMRVRVLKNSPWHVNNKLHEAPPEIFGTIVLYEPDFALPFLVEHDIMHPEMHCGLNNMLKEKRGWWYHRNSLVQIQQFTWNADLDTDTIFD